MLRIYKNYNLPYRIGGNGKTATEPVPARQLVFPSYPAVPFSLDDFYQTSVGMVRSDTQHIAASHNLFGVHLSVGNH
jgi:hypothetical protein